MASLAFCAVEQKPCVLWVKRYFGDCMCNGKDWFSFGFGIISLVCWGVAEIPQIITNFRTKSSHGVSLAFLLTWVVGDVFNMVGCVMDPATLPTQLYTAELYTASTVILVVQGLYYDHFYKHWNLRKRKIISQDEDVTTPLKPSSVDFREPISTVDHITKSRTQRAGYYFTSARSLAGSGTPPFRSYLRVVRSVPEGVGNGHESSSDDDGDEGCAGAVPTSTTTATQPLPIPRNSAAYGTFIASSLSLPFQAQSSGTPAFRFTSRRLLNEHVSSKNGTLGEILGWLMAAIYMGGRLPQIWLNIKRGSVEGLNPLMFLFALVANLAYVLSIVVRSVEWESIGPNLPWLLDAVVCVMLDFFVSFHLLNKLFHRCDGVVLDILFQIILQYIYYRNLSTREEQVDKNAIKSPKPC